MQILFQIDARNDWENPDFTKSEFVELIKCAEDPEAVRRLKEEAVRIREIYYGKKVFTRGLIEYTNYCKNDCYYCGIRKSNANAKRYRLTEEEIMACCENGYELGFRTFEKRWNKKYTMNMWKF